MTHLADLDTIAERISALSRQLPPTTRLIAVTKKVETARIRQAYDAGIRDFGESRIQELEVKVKELKDLPGISWHFIGHLQRNKAKQAVELCDWIHSVDSLALARRLDHVAEAAEHKPKLCLQVKLTSDPQKYGWSEAQLKTDLSELLKLEQIDIRGLMTILPLGLTDNQVLQTFEKTRHLARQITDETQGTLSLQELSMGMSGDYQWAIEAGATMIRLGQILFGSRQ